MSCGTAGLRARRRRKGVGACGEVQGARLVVAGPVRVGESLQRLDHAEAGIHQQPSATSHTAMVRRNLRERVSSAAATRILSDDFMRLLLKLSNPDGNVAKLITRLLFGLWNMRSLWLKVMIKRFSV
jgi:hypothetical protein